MPLPPAGGSAARRRGGSATVGGGGRTDRAAETGGVRETVTSSPHSVWFAGRDASLLVSFYFAVIFLLF